MNDLDQLDQLVVPPRKLLRGPVGLALGAVLVVALVILFAAWLLHRPLAAHRPANRSDDDLLAEGWQHFRLGEFDLAGNAFHMVVDTPPADNAAAGIPLHHRAQAAAWYGIASVQWLGAESDLPKSRRSFARAIDADPHGPYAPWSALQLVRMTHLDALTGAGVDAPALHAGYDRVIAEYPNTPAAEEAYVFGVSLYVASTDPADARRAAESIQQHLKAKPSTPYRTAMEGLLKIALKTAGDQAGSFNAGIQEIATITSLAGATNDALANDLYALGLQAEYDLGDFAAARENFQHFLTDFPNDQRAEPVYMELNYMNDLEAALARGDKTLPPRRRPPQLDPLTGAILTDKPAASAPAAGGGDAR